MLTDLSTAATPAACWWLRPVTPAGSATSAVGRRLQRRRDGIVTRTGGRRLVVAVAGWSIMLGTSSAWLPTTGPHGPRKPLGLVGVANRMESARQHTSGDPTPAAPLPTFGSPGVCNFRRPRVCNFRRPLTSFPYDAMTSISLLISLAPPPPSATSRESFSVTSPTVSPHLFGSATPSTGETYPSETAFCRHSNDRP